MPQLTLSLDELGFLLERSGVEPTHSSPFSQMGVAAALEDSARLIEGGLVNDRGGTLKVNLQLHAGLQVVADPEEVIDLTIVGAVAQTGFTVCRRDESYVQCNLDPEGAATLAFPVNRGLLIAAVALAFSGARELPAPLGVHFSCHASTAFVLGSLVRRFTASPTELSVVRAGILQDLDDPEAILPIVLAEGEEEVARLRDDPAALFAELAVLVDKSLVVQQGTSVQVCSMVAELLGAPVLGSAFLQRLERRNDIEHKAVFHALRLGDRIVLVMPQVGPSGRVVQYWEEVDRETLRSAAIAFLMTPAEVEQAFQGAGTLIR